MSPEIRNKSYKLSNFCESEILRYAACNASDENTTRLLRECIKEIESGLSYKVCFTEIDVDIRGNLCDFDLFKVYSDSLSRNLKDCKRVILFAATLGTEIDRMILKYSKISPAKALMFQAIGAERIEVLCDRFCLDIKNEIGLDIKPRFSPGYGDLSLKIQNDIIKILNTQKLIGLYLNDSLIMSPSKSVTAFIGIKDEVLRY